MDSSFFSFEYVVTEFKAALFIDFTSYILKWITLEAYRSNGILSRSCFVKTYFAFRRFLSFYSFFPPWLVSFLPLGCSSDRSPRRFSSSSEKKNRDSWFMRHFLNYQVEIFSLALFANPRTSRTFGSWIFTFRASWQIYEHLPISSARAKNRDIGSLRCFATFVPSSPFGLALIFASINHSRFNR